jgi:hypothetical protein
MKKRATPVMIDPEAYWAQVWRPIPRTTSDNPQTAPREARKAKRDVEDSVNIILSPYAAAGSLPARL